MSLSSVIILDSQQVAWDSFRSGPTRVPVSKRFLSGFNRGTFGAGFGAGCGVGLGGGAPGLFTHAFGGEAELTGDVKAACSFHLWLTAKNNTIAKPTRISPAAIKINMCFRPARHRDTKTSSSGETKLTKAFL
jgi:hypothetical protein